MLRDDKDKSDECKPEPEEVCKEEAKEKDPCEDEKTPGGGGAKKLEGKGREGVIHAVIGPVIDVYFPDEIPEILNAMEVVDAPIGRLVLEVRSLTVNSTCQIFTYSF